MLAKVLSSSIEENTIPFNGPLFIFVLFSALPGYMIA
jgi:hypothetical protein